MILKASQRSGAAALADHLTNSLDNDHIELLETRGFMAEDLHGAFAEAYAISKATRCRQYLFSLSLNPPQDHVASEEQCLNAAERIEDQLGEAVLGAVGDRAAGSGPRELRRFDLAPFLLCLLFGVADPRHFRVGVGDAGEEIECARARLHAIEGADVAPRAVRQEKVGEGGPAVCGREGKAECNLDAVNVVLIEAVDA